MFTSPRIAERPNGDELRALLKEVQGISELRPMKNEAQTRDWLWRVFDQARRQDLLRESDETVDSFLDAVNLPLVRLRHVPCEVMLAQDRILGGYVYAVCRAIEGSKIDRKIRKPFKNMQPGRAVDTSPPSARQPEPDINRPFCSGHLDLRVDNSRQEMMLSSFPSSRPSQDWPTGLSMLTGSYLEKRRPRSVGACSVV